MSAKKIFCAEGNLYFMVPEAFVPATGPDKIKDTHGNVLNVPISTLLPYQCTFEEAQQYLKTQWQTTVARARDVWKQMNYLTELGGKTSGMEQFSESFMSVLKNEQGEMPEAFEQGKQAVERLMNAIASGNPATPEAEQKILQDIFSKMPGIESFFTKEEWEKIADDPDAWAGKLHEKFITPAEKEKQKKAQEKLAADVQASIAAGLRKAGIKPAEDFEQNSKK